LLTYIIWIVPLELLGRLTGFPNLFLLYSILCCHSQAHQQSDHLVIIENRKSKQIKYHLSRWNSTGADESCSRNDI